LKARENLSAYQGSKVPQFNSWIKQRRPEIENSVVPSGFQYMSGIAMKLCIGLREYTSVEVYTSVEQYASVEVYTSAEQYASVEV